MDIRWGLFMITSCLLYASDTSAWQTYTFTEGEDATITFSQALDKPLEAYVWSLQYAHRDRPFYIYVGGNTDGTLYSDMLILPDQRNRMTVSFEMKDGVLLVNVSFAPIKVYEKYMFLLNVLEKFSDQPLFVLETYIYVLPMNEGGNDFEDKEDDGNLRGEGRYCSLAYTAPQVNGWRWVMFSVYGGKGAIFYCYELYPLTGDHMTHHTFDVTFLFKVERTINIYSRYYCCLKNQDQVRCEYYELDSSGNLMLTNVTSQAPYKPLEKSPILPAAIDTVVRDLLVELSVPLAISMLANIALVIILLWVYYIRPRRRKRNMRNSAESIVEQMELDEDNEMSELRRRPLALSLID